MNVSRQIWLGALAASLALLFVFQFASADNPPATGSPAAAPQAQAANSQPPAGAEQKAVPGPRDPAAAAASKRRFEVEQFVRMFRSFPSGVDLAKELKITDDQAAKLPTILARVEQEESAFRGFPSNPAGRGRGGRAPQKSLLERETALADIYTRGKQDIAAVLSPEQMARAEQIELQTRIRSAGVARTLETDLALRELNLSADQVALLKEAETAAQREFLKDYEALREQQLQKLAEARKRIVGVLTPDQKAGFEKLIGAPLAEDDYSLSFGLAGFAGRPQVARPPQGFGGRGDSPFTGMFGRRGQPSARPAETPPAEARPSEANKP